MTCMGFLTEKLGWTRRSGPYAYMVYDGNEATLTPSKTLKGLEKYTCPHFPAETVGDRIVTAL